MRKFNPTIVALVFGAAILILVVAFLVVNRNPDQDKLSDEQINQIQAGPSSSEKRCSSQATYELIKRELFRRAAEIRGSDQAAYEKLTGFAIVRMENAVMESEDATSGTVNCSGSLSLDLPPGVAVAGGRRTLASGVDYSLDRNNVLTIRNAEAIVTPLATLGRVAEPVEQTASPDQADSEQASENVAASESAKVQPGPATAYPGRPSFDCTRARTQGEIAVCSDSGLAALDVTMATQYGRALSRATPDQKAMLESSRNRFLGYRDRCPNRQCMADAYMGRLHEIRDIMEGRWRAPR